MPLKKSASKKAFSENVRTEMHHGHPQDQSLAIAYSVQRKARRKKHAEGGQPEPDPSPSPSKVDIILAPVKKYVKTHTDGGPKEYAEGGSISASNEKRPMPKDRHNDAMDIRENDHMRDNGEDGWTDRPDMKQSQNKPKTQPIKHPRMVPSDAFSARLYDREGNLQESAKPGKYNQQPDHWMDEEEAKKQGSSPDMTPEHSTHRKPYAKGGEVEASDKKHPKNPYEDDHLEHLDPSEDEGEMYADEHDEEDPIGHGPKPDMEEEHSTGKMPYARGGHVSLHDEEEMEHEDSIASAIMAKKAKERGHPAAMSDSDIDEMVMLYDGGMYAEGGEILESEHMEEPNNEDQMSFEALKKENYNSSDLDIDQPMDSNEHSPEHEPMDEHDEGITSEIRRRMKHKQFKQR